MKATITVENLEFKSGVGKNGVWNMVKVLSSDGQEFICWDKPWADDHLKIGEEVEIEFVEKTKGKYTNHEIVTPRPARQQSGGNPDFEKKVLARLEIMSTRVQNIEKMMMNVTAARAFAGAKEDPEGPGPLPFDEEGEEAGVELATPAQHRKIFALGSDLELTPDGTKGYVKKIYGLDSFSNLSKEQAKEVIDRMEKAKAETIGEEDIPF